MSSEVEILETGQVKILDQLIPGLTVETSQEVQNNNWDDSIPVYIVRLADRTGFAYHDKIDLATTLTLLHFYNDQLSEAARP